MTGLDNNAALEAVKRARAAGADEVAARISQGVTTDLGWRDGRLEKIQESRSLSLRVSLMVDGRFSAHLTNDLRPDALDAFLARAVEATRALEPDPDRRLPDRASMGVADDDLDTVDPGAPPTAAELRARAQALEAEARGSAARLPLVSAGVELWASHNRTELCCSNGFRGVQEGTQHGAMVALTMTEEDGRKPEAYVQHVARFRADLPPSEAICHELVARAERRLGSHKAPSGRYPVVVSATRAPRLLGFLLTPLSGQTLHEGRSCFLGRLGQRLSPNGLTLLDDPLIRRGQASRRFDADGLPACRLPIFQDGALCAYLLDVYYARKLGMNPTTGSSSNLCIPAGARSVGAILADLPRAILIDGFLGGNINPATGVFSLGVSGALYQGGSVVHNVSEMNLSGNLFELLERFVEAADDPYLLSSARTPSLCFDAMQLAGA